MSAWLLVPLTAAVSGCGSTLAHPDVAPGACTGTVRVATDPAAAADAADGATTEMGARLAVDQANANRLLGDCYIAFGPAGGAPSPSPEDPDQAASAVSALAADADVVGMVGPFRSSAAPAELRVANRAGLTTISPSNTDPGLTIEGSNPDVDTRSLRPTSKLTFFRVCATDLGEGRAMARVATDVLQARRVYVIDDQSSYGRQLADQFQRYLPAQRNVDVHRVSDPPGKRDFHDDLSRARQAGAELVFFGGTAVPAAGGLRRGMAASLPRAEFLGGDAIVTPGFFTAAGPAAEGALGTMVGADPTRPESARFLNDYQVDFGSDPGPYSIAAYDGMNVLLQAIKRAVIDSDGHLPADRGALRELVRARVASTSYDGLLGHLTFNDRGDTPNVLVTVAKAMGGRWVFDRAVHFTTG